jgi:hypothetical protein
MAFGHVTGFDYAIIDKNGGVVFPTFDFQTAAVEIAPREVKYLLETPFDYCRVGDRPWFISRANEERKRLQRFDLVLPEGFDEFTIAIFDFNLHPVTLGGGMDFDFTSFILLVEIKKKQAVDSD